MSPRAPRCAYLASAGTLPGSPVRRADAWEHDRTMAALRGHGVDWEDVAWDAPGVDWGRYDAVVIGTTWDYADRRAEFVAALGAVAAHTRLFNPLPLVTWNTDKRYLADLAARGAPSIPTVWLDAPDPPAVAAAFDQLGADDVVFKRQVGAGAAGQFRLRRGEAPPPLGPPLLAQPYLPAIAAEGELSVVMIDGAVSHALVKRPAAGDYRVQSIHGGHEEAIHPDPADLAAATAVVGLLPAVPLYARVDLVRGPDGRLRLMELELVEPYLYPEQGPALGERLAAALRVRIA